MATIKSRKDLAENRRACILKAARCVFARQGYAQTVVDDIAGQAGIAKGTLYLYFRSKEEVFLAALVEDTRGMEQLTRERMQSAASWREKLAAYIGVRMEYLESHSDFLRIYLSEIRGRLICGMRMQSDLQQVMRESEGQLAQMFAASIARNEIRPVDPNLAALTVLDVTRGLMERRLLGWSCMTTAPADAEFALDILYRAFAPALDHPEPDHSSVVGNSTVGKP